MYCDVCVLPSIFSSKFANYIQNGQPLYHYFPGALDDWDRYCDTMRTVGIWGDHLTLIAIAEIFRLRVVLISSVIIISLL